MNRDILIRPLVTEKLTRLMEAGHYTFVVDKAANKVEIRKAIEDRYPGVVVREVRTMIQRGKRRRQMTRKGLSAGRTAAYKKAFITLDPTGPQIDFFEQI